MDIMTSVPVRLNRLESLAALVEPVRERIAQRAYEHFIDRDGFHGHDVEDWLNAERELIVSAVSEMRCNAGDVIVEVALSEVDMGNVAVHVGATHLVILSQPNENGRQALEVIALPSSISVDGVDAEREGNTIRIAAALDESYEVLRAAG